MAKKKVTRTRSNSDSWWWIWILLVIVAILLVGFLVQNYGITGRAAGDLCLSNIDCESGETCNSDGICDPGGTLGEEVLPDDPAAAQAFVDPDDPTEFPDDIEVIPGKPGDDDEPVLTPEERATLTDQEQKDLIRERTRGDDGGDEEPGDREVKKKKKNLFTAIFDFFKKLFSGREPEVETADFDSIESEGDQPREQTFEEDVTKDEERKAAIEAALAGNLPSCNPDFTCDDPGEVCAVKSTQHSDGTVTDETVCIKI